MTTRKKLQEISSQVETHGRNPGMPLELDWVNEVRVNKSAVERRAQTIGTRRSIKKQWQAAWLLKAISCIDLTTLAGDDTPGRVKRLCAKAKQPVRKDILKAFEINNLTVGAVCVYHNRVEEATEFLKGTRIPVAAVSTGFPAGQISLEEKIRQIKQSVSAGAHEIDIVISRDHVLRGDWESLYSEVSAFREACGASHMKTILATGELATLRQVAKSSLVCMMAGADFIKTSTGMETVNATLEVSLTMIRQIREYHYRTGYKIGFKPAGGIKKAKQTLAWLALMKEELGNEWLDPSLFRFGASTLLMDVERQLEHNLSNQYSASYRHPMA
ncbi:MAG: deoxyribose-phosphate aldolase [Candidatus Heimdallarchaeota archaeon]